MENRLDFIEQILKHFFEQVSEAENQWLRELIQQIMHALTLHAIPQDEGYAILPEIVQIYISPNDENRIPNMQQFIQISMPELLTQLARENFIIRNEPVISIATAPEIAWQEMKIVAIPVSDTLDDTAVLTHFSSMKGDNPKSLNAFLLFPDGRDFPLIEKTINVGRNPENHLVLDYPMVSRHQAQIRYIDGVHHLFDIQSTSGTYINDVMIEHGILNSGDVIRFADQKLIYITDISQTNQSPSPRDFDTQEIIQ
jgi:hypothetical protein